MKNFYLTLILLTLVTFSHAQNFDLSLSLLGINSTTGRYEVALMGTPNFTEANGNSADIGAVISISDNIYIDPNGFVNDCTTSGPPTFEITCEYVIEKEEWTANYLTDPSNASSGRYVYQLLRTETGEASFFDAQDGVAIVLAVFQIYNTESGLPSAGDIVLVDNDDPILNGTFNASFLNIRYETTTSATTVDLFNQHSTTENSVNFDILNTSGNTLSGISLSPNPTSGIVNIKELSNFKQIDIYNVNGQLVKTFFNDNNIDFIDVSELQMGVYFANIMTNNAKTTVKLIKK